MNVKEIFSLGVDIAVNGLPTSKLIPLSQAVIDDISTSNSESGITGYVDFLYAAAPYVVCFFLVIFIAIVILKIAVNKREKKLSSQPQFNRFDLDTFELDEQDEEKKEKQENDST